MRWTSSRTFIIITIIIIKETFLGDPPKTSPEMMDSMICKEEAICRATTQAKGVLDDAEKTLLFGWKTQTKGSKEKLE